MENTTTLCNSSGSDSSTTVRKLRTPNTPMSDLINEGFSNPPSNASIKVKPFESTLSAEAPEFVPKNFQQIPNSVPALYAGVTQARPSTAATSTPSNSVQNRLKLNKTHLSHNNSDGGGLGAQASTEFTGVSVKPEVTSTDAINSNNKMCGDNDDEFFGSADEVRFIHLINTLTKDAGQFEDLIDIFMETLQPYFVNILVISHITKTIVNQAINEPSFRYTAARLFCTLEQHCPEYRAELHLTCKEYYRKESNKSGLLMFVAELYAQLHHDNIYSSFLIETFQHLLDLGNTEYIKPICQALKLTGYSLEFQNNSAVDGIVKKLQDLSRTIEDRSCNKLIDSIINLKNSNWGQSSNSLNQINSEFNLEQNFQNWTDNNNYYHTTTFYDANGLKYTQEENEFLAENVIDDFLNLENHSDSDELYDPEPEMDKEIQEAFKDFVKISKR